MQRQALPGKELGLGEHEAAGIYPAQKQALAFGAIEPVGQTRAEVGQRIEAGHHE
ncbi:hypothetical protein D3C78_1815810 [compost metagenome]